MKPCWDPLSPFPLFSPGVIANGAFVAFALGFAVYLRVLVLWKPTAASSTSYGMGGHAICQSLSELVLVISAPRLVLFGAFRAAAGVDIRAGELACQLQNSIPISSLLLCLVLMMLGIVNVVRLCVRHKLVVVAGGELMPAPGAASRGVTRCAVLPAYRGVWIPTVARAFAHAAGRLPAVIYGLDAFGTPFCRDDDAWLRHNMAREGLRVKQREAARTDNAVVLVNGDDARPSAPLLGELEGDASAPEVRVLWTGFERLPLKRASLDLVVMPSFSFIPALSSGASDGRQESKEHVDGRRVAFLTETLRTLLPGGRCVLVVTGSSTAPTEELMRRAGFSDVRTLPGSFYYSWMPSRVVVGLCAAAAAQATSPVEAASVGPSTAATAPVVDDYGDGGDSDTAALPSGGLMSRLASAAEPERLSMILRAQARSRHGPHWALWWPLMAVMSSIYAFVVLATWAYIEDLLVPSFLPYSNSAASLMVSNTTMMPVAVYFMAAALTAFGDALDKEAAEGTHPPPPLQGHASRHADPRVRMLLKFAGMLLNLLAALSVLQLVGWAPTFFVDYALVKSGHFDGDSLRGVNIAVSVLIVAVLVPVGRRVWACYEAWRERRLAQAERAESATINEPLGPTIGPLTIN